MAQQVPFIDRDDELTLIDQAIGEWGTQKVIGFRAEGGIGKTRLLQEIYERYKILVPSSFPEEKANRKKITVALVQELTNSEWSQQFVSGARAMARQPDIALIETDAGSDTEKMVSDLDNVIEQSPDAVIISLGTNANLGPGIQKAIARGIKVLTFDNYLSGVEGITTRVSQDDYSGANISLEHLAKDINFQGKLVAGWIPGFAPLERRKLILDTVLQKYPDIKLVDEFNVLGENLEKESYQKIREILHEHTDIKAIWASWDEFAKGAVRALREEKRTDVAVYSFDLCPSDVDQIIEPGSPWRATVGTDPYENGRLIVRLAALSAWGTEIRRQYPIPMQLFTQESLRKLGKQKQPIWDKLDIGVPPVLHELEENHPVRRLSVTNIIDFDDSVYHISQNVGRKIAQMVGEKDFAPYLQRLLDYRKMEIGKVSSERLTQEGLAVNQVFVDCFNKVASRQRIVLLFDTIEKLSGTDVFKYLLGLGSKLTNVVLVIAGRPEASWELLQSQLGDNIQIIDLPNLDEEASAAYLRAKQDLLHITLESELVEKLLFLAQGRPILIDLALEWRARRKPLDWLIKIRQETLLALPEDEKKERQIEFEKQLVSHIIETRSNMDWLVLMLAKVYPLDVEMITELLNIPKSKAEVLFREAKTFVFIKSLPDGRIALHDEMCRMVNEYVWPEVDPKEERRRSDSRRAADYLKATARAIYEQIAQLELKEKQARKTKNIRMELNAFIERETLERQLWVLEGQRLNHTLFIDLVEGINTFAETFDWATSNYSFSFRETLVAQVQQFTHELSKEQRYEVDSRRVRYLMDEGIYDQARALLHELLETLPVSAEQKLRLLMQSGDVEIQAGNFEKGIGFYEQAAGICRDQKWEDKLVQAEKALGYSYRLTGDWESALSHYMDSYIAALKLGDREQQGWLLNNLAFVYTLRQWPSDVALNLSDQAIKLWTELGSKRGLGAAYSTRGSILYEFGKYEEALPHFDQALEIFEPQDDFTWLSTVYNWRGITKWALGQSNNDWQLFEQARQDLEKALDIGLPRDQAMVLNRLSRVYRSLKQNSKARQLSEQSYEFALKNNDKHYEIVALDTLALLDVHEGKFSTLGDFEKRVQQYLENCPKETQRDYVTLGRLYCRLGHLALGQRKTEAAIKYYKDGLSLVSKYSSYGWFSLPPLLANLESTWKNEFSPLPKGFVANLGNILAE